MSHNRWGTGAAALALAIAGAAPAAARTVGAREHVEGTVLRHGSVEMRMEMAPVPRLTGPGTDLQASAGRMLGTFEDGHWDVRFDNERAEGRGPRGEVSLTMTAT